MKLLHVTFLMPGILMCNSRFWGNLCTLVKCSKMYVCGSLFWLKRDVNEATDFVDRYKGVGQRRDLIPYLFNVSVHQPHYRPEVPRGFQEVKVPRLSGNGPGWW